MPYTQTSIQEEMNIIDNRPFQHSSKKRHQVKDRIDKIHPSLYLISLSLLTRAEWWKGLLTLSLLLTSHSCLEKSRYEKREFSSLIPVEHKSS